MSVDYLNICAVALDITLQCAYLRITAFLSVAQVCFYFIVGWGWLSDILFAAGLVELFS